jgi:hypothetical protein
MQGHGMQGCRSVKPINTSKAVRQGSHGKGDSFLDTSFRELFSEVQNFREDFLVPFRLNLMTRTRHSLAHIYFGFSVSNLPICLLGIAADEETRSRKLLQSFLQEKAEPLFRIAHVHREMLPKLADKS